MALPSPMEIISGSTLAPSMLSYNGNILLIVVHALLWFTPAFIILANKDDMEKGQGDLEKQILTLYWVFSFSTPVILVAYEIGMWLMGYYPKGFTIAQGVIFGFGYLTLGLGAASTANLNDKDNVNMMVLALFFTSSALGMYTTFYTTFLKQHSKGDRPLLGN